MPTRRSPRRLRSRPAALIVSVLLALLIIAFAAARLRPRPPRPRPAPSALRPPAPPPPAPGPAVRHDSPLPEPKFQCAIIIDDVGYNQTALREFLDLDMPLTFAVLPRLPLSERLAQAAADAGHSVMLHLPMEPVDPANLRYMGPGGVTTAMSDDEIEAQVIADLDSLGTAAGVNNHMGSKATADLRVMAAVMRVAARRGLFFVDSGTTPHSVAHQAAGQAGVPVAQRDVFLDTDSADDEAIRGRIRQLIAAAEEQGSAIGIGHCRPGTARALAALRDEFARQAVALVPAGDLAARSE